MKFCEEIEGERLNLCRLKKNYEMAELFVSEAKKSLSELKPWLDWATPSYNCEYAYEYLLMCHKDWEEEKGFTYSIMSPQGRFMGVVAVTRIDKVNNSAMFGYWISTEFSGKGYMQEAMKVLEKIAFEAGLNKLVIRTDVLNLKSARIAKKLGYHLDGVLRQEMYSKTNESYRDINIFSKLKSEYMQG